MYTSTSPGDLKQAQTVFEDLVSLDPTDGNGYFGLGKVADAKGLLDQATALYLEAAARPTRDQALVRVSLGKARLAQGRSLEAVQEYKGACDISPGFVVAWLGLGDALLTQGDLMVSHLILVHT